MPLHSINNFNLRYIINCLFIFQIVLLQACSSQPEKVVVKQTPTTYKPSYEIKNIPLPNVSPQARKPYSIRSVLLSHYNDWHGVPYHYGGLSKQGVDCSGFVYITFKKLFSITLPRTTSRQSSAGDNISVSNLRNGDLVFFKRGRGFRHVGIYLDNGNFMHASTTKGITISSINNPFWSERFWTAKRILKN